MWTDKEMDRRKDRQIDMTKLIIAFRNFAKRASNYTKQRQCCRPHLKLRTAGCKSVHFKEDQRSALYIKIFCKFSRSYSKFHISFSGLYAAVPILMSKSHLSVSVSNVNYHNQDLQKFLSFSSLDTVNCPIYFFFLFSHQLSLLLKAFTNTKL